MKRSLLFGAGVILAITGCSKPKEAPKAEATATPSVEAPKPKKPAVKPDTPESLARTVKTEEDFEDEAERQITEENLEDEIKKLEQELLEVPAAPTSSAAPKGN